MIRKLTALAFVTLLIALAFGNDTTQVKKSSRFYAGVSFTPGVSYRLLKENKFGPDSMDAVIQHEILNDRIQHEIPQFEYTIGFKAGFKATSFLNIETGLEYASPSYRMNSKNIYVTGNWNGSGYDTTGSYQVNYRYRYHYLNIPLGLNFVLGKKKLQCAIATGVNLNVFITHTTTAIILEGGKATSHSPSNDRDNKWISVNVSPYLGIGLDYHINSLMLLRIMPMVHMQCLKNRDTPITEYLYGGGLNMSLLFNLPKAK